MTSTRRSATSQRALALDPSSSVVHFYIGEVLYNRGVNEGALDALKRAVELNPQNPDALLPDGLRARRHGPARGGARGRRGRPIQLNPTLSRAQANLAHRPATAAAARGAARRRAPTARMTQMEVHAEGQLAHFNLGLAFRQKGYYAEALREYAKALERGEDRAARAAGDGRGAPAAPRGRGRRWSCTTSCSQRSPTAPSSGTSAAWRCTRRGSSRTRRRATAARVQAELGLCARAQQPRRRALSSRATPTRRSPPSASRSRRSRRS